VVSTPLYPIFSIFPGMVSPGAVSPKPGSFSSRKVVMLPYTDSAPVSVLTSVATTEEYAPLVSHIFCPSRT
jgi:hypothetical protein